MLKLWLSLTKLKHPVLGMVSGRFAECAVLGELGWHQKELRSDRDADSDGIMVAVEEMMPVPEIIGVLLHG